VADSRILKVAIVAVWIVVGAVVAALVFMRGALPSTAPVAGAGGVRPVMYEFSTDT